MDKLFLGDVMKKVLKLLLFLSLVDILVGLYYFVCLILPKVQMLYSNDLTVYNNQNEVIIQTHHDVTGQYVSLKQMSPYLPIAFIAAEDQNFYRHYGYDLGGILRAAFNTIFKGNTQGGSTITQQLARTLFLSNEKTLSRKIQEAILTARIEMNYSKDEILEQYLNSIYLGHDLYGVAVASRYYFNKSCQDLTLDEAAMLAGIANAPAINAPDIHYENALKRKNYVLSNLYENKQITKEIYETYKNIDTPIQIQPLAKENAYQFYQREIVKELKNLGLYTKKNLAIGLNIYTSFSTKVTDIVYQVLQQFRPNTDTQAAILVLKPYTNQILAMAGSFSVEDEYNRALMSVRQVGSTIKPCIYYMALDYGFTPISKFKSEKTTFHIEGIGDYSPQNSNHVYANRDITMIEAVAVSDNIYSTKTLLFLGTSKLNDFLSLFGVDANNEVPSAALGVHELTLLQLASIYNTFAAEGKYYEPKFIQKITDKRGKVLYQAKQTGKQILNPSTTLILNQLLRAPFDANAQGYATPTLLNYQPDAIYAAKTGSTLQDSLVVAYNPNYTIAVWVGKDNNEPLYETSLSRKMFEEIANRLTTKENVNDWYEKGLFLKEEKINPLTGYDDPNGSYYWFKD